jgi:hypothetical protein
MIIRMKFGMNTHSFFPINWVKNFNFPQKKLKFFTQSNQTTQKDDYC